MKARIYGLAPNTFVDGPGIRFGIFFQGCVRECAGCQNPESWAIHGGMEMDTDEIKRMILADPLLDGITLSGGEPFLQPEAAADLAGFARQCGLNVWCWSGYTFEQIAASRDGTQALRNIDVLVDGPYEQETRSLELAWRGSGNQRVIDVAESLKKGRAVLLGENEEGAKRRLGVEDSAKGAPQTPYPANAEGRLTGEKGTDTKTARTDEERPKRNKPGRARKAAEKWYGHGSRKETTK